MLTFWVESIRVARSKGVVWRSIVINRPARLKRENFSLVIDQEERAHVPFEDIAVIVLNHREITITHPVLSSCAEYGIGIYSTGANHQPNGFFLPFLQHSRATGTLRLQLGLDRPTAKRAWAKIVQQKIYNQSRCVGLMGLSGSERLNSYARRVRSGDSSNLEAQASAYYFPQLFGIGFYRSKADWVNAALNYGYSVMRGACARALVLHGLFPSFGLFHSNERNAFNLADDLIEPYRPIVDLHVANNVPIDSTRDLQPGDKASLVGLLNVDVGMSRGNMSALASIDQAASSLVRLYERSDDQALELPVLIGLRKHLIDR